MRRSIIEALIALVGATIAACSGAGPERVGNQPSWRTVEVSTAPRVGSAAAPPVGSAAPASVTFAPVSEPATRYNEPLQAPPHTAFRDAAIAAVKQAAAKAGVAAPAADARLFRACDELAEVVPDDGIISFRLVEFALQRNGVIEPSTYLFVNWGDLESPEPIFEQVKSRVATHLADATIARFGVGSAKRASSGKGAVVVSLLSSGVATSPIPRAVGVGESFLIDAVVDARFRDPALFVTRETGTVERVPLKLGHAGALRSTVPCGSHQGKQQVEITASDRNGSTVLANFPVWCGSTPPSSLTVTPSIDDTPLSHPVDVERRLLALINRDRHAANLPPLVWDERVAAVARAHSEEMKRTKLVAHISPTTGAAADRVRAANIKTAVVMENIVHALGVGEAHQGLMNSPGHRANILASLATHVGVGVVFGDEDSGRRELFVTQVFTRIPPKVEIVKATKFVLQQLTAVHPSVQETPRVSAIAQEMATALAQGKTREQVYPAVKRQIDALDAYSKVTSAITAVAQLEALDGGSLLGGLRPMHVGIGVAQGPEPTIGDNAIWVVLLFADKR
ncbi:MAG: CAP domain-containing protein [Kofleriaceae bacterium]